MSTFKEIIEEAIKEFSYGGNCPCNMESTEEGDQLLEKISSKYAQKLQPASSPEELEVWVDGEKSGRPYMIEPANANDFLISIDMPNGLKGETLVKECRFHIQIINSKTGLVVMDNCETKNEDQ
jgi:hypothetical protein